MSPRPAPSGADLHAVIRGDHAYFPDTLLTADEVQRRVSRAFKTSFPTAARWVDERILDGSLPLVRVRLDGAHHALRDTNATEPSTVVAIYAIRGPGFDYRLSTDGSTARRQDNRDDGIYYAHTEGWDAVVAEAAEARRKAAAKHAAERAAARDVVPGLRALLRAAGVDDVDVDTYVTTASHRDGGTSAVVMVPAEALPRVEALLAGLFAQDTAQ